MKVTVSITSQVSPCVISGLSTDNKEYDAYLSYTKVDLDSLGRSVVSDRITHSAETLSSSCG